MLRRKQDVDKHVSSILMRRKDERERNAQGYQIARLYVDIKEYNVARRYLSGFLSVRENVPTAYQLMGEINEGLGQKDEAIASYKRALDLGGFVSSNRHLVMKICELYTEIGTDVPRMKYWLEQLEKLDPRSDTVFRLKARITEADNENGNNTDGQMEDIITAELVNQPTDLKLRIKLLQLYLDTDRCDEAYDVGVACDLTTAFVDALPWFQCLHAIFKQYGENNADTKTDTAYSQHYLHVLRNLVYLSLPGKDVTDCAEALSRFDQHLKHAVAMGNSNEAWAAMLKEMKGQLFFLAALVLLKRAQTGMVSWKDINPLSGACLLASKSLEPLDAQAPWFVSASASHTKFYTWWQQQSSDRLSQVGHLLQQLSQKKRWEDVCEWGLGVRKDFMTPAGQQRIFELLYRPRDVKAQGAVSFLFQAQEMVAAGSGRREEPFTDQGLLGVDRVAYQVHLGDLNHLVWLCLQRYSPDMSAQPNYHFSVMENIQFSVKSLENTAAETLSQLDLLVFLLATVRCAASAISENVLHYADSSGRPALLPVCLSKPFVTQEQREWWEAAYKFCTNSVRDDFSRLRRILVRGLEAIRLVDSHGFSAQLMVHIARSLDAKAKSYITGEHGCRCSAQELAQLEIRAAFYWEKAKAALQKAQKNQHTPMPKKRLFKEVGDVDPSPAVVKTFLDEAVYALAYHAMKTGKTEEAIKGFEKLRTPWAKFYSAKIYRTLSDQEAERDGESEDSVIKRRALVVKARQCLYDTIDRLEGDKAHELNLQIYKELDDLEETLHGLELDERNASANHSFHTPVKSPSELQANGTPGASVSGLNLGHSTSTPRQSSSGASHVGNGNYRTLSEPQRASTMEEDYHHDVSSSTDRPDENHRPRPRPSPERLDAQLRSVSFSQSSMFKMVLDRNDELIMINSKLMEELRDNNNQLKNVLSENQSLMADLKDFLGENRDTMRQIKNELSALKSSVTQQQQVAAVAAAAAPPPPVPPPIAPTPPLYLPPHMAGVAPPPRGPAYPNFPPPAYPHGPGYMINSPLAVAAARPPVTMGPGFRPSGLPGSQSSNVGKYRSDEDDDEVDPEDLHSAEEAAAMFEYADDPTLSQYFTPEAQMMQDWATGAGMDGSSPNPLNIPTVPQPPQPGGSLPPRMSIPSPGYFASALRGQALYAQSTPPPAQVRPPPIGPGFFSSPLTSTASGGISSGQPSLLAALTGQPGGAASSNNLLATPTSSGTDSGPSMGATSINLSPTLSGLKSLFQSKGVLEPSKVKGDITILVDTNSRRATILMMGETKDILFHHDIQGLFLEHISVTPNSLAWTATKIGTANERERVWLSLDTLALAAKLREAISKATAMIQPKNVPQGGTNGSPQLFGSLAASTPASSVAPSLSASIASSTPSLFSLTPASSAGTAATTGKPSFGGFTFSQAPVITPATTVAEKPKAQIGVPATTKTEAKPFANFSLTPSTPAASKISFGMPGESVTSQKSPQAITTPKSPGKAGGDDDHVEEYEPNVDFKPVIALPDLVEKTTGEENESALFVERCRLYRFDSDTKQWKERGVGELKILSSKDEVRFRIIMRRDQILKLCANHCLSAEMNLTAMPASDRAWCYSAHDYSEEEIKLEKLAVKFKDAGKATAFKDVFTKCCQQLKDDASKPQAAKEKAPAKPTSAPAAAASSMSSGTKQQQPSLSDLFKPQAGSWECDGCLVRNNGDVTKCPACGTLKPGAQPAAGGGGGGSSFSFGANAGPQGTGFSFGAPAATTAPSTGGFVFGNKPATTTTAASSSTTGGDGFIFGKPAATSGPTTTASTAGGFVFGKPAETTTTAATTGGYVFGKPAATATTTASSGFKFNLPAASSTATTTSTTSSFAPTGSGGFKFGSPAVGSGSSVVTPVSTSPAASGFSFKLGQSTAASTTASPSVFGGTTSKPSQFSFATTASNTNTSSAASSGGLLAKLLTSDEPGKQGVSSLAATASTSSGFPKPSGTFSFSMAPKTTTQATASTQGFQFSMAKSPQKAGSPAKPTVPGSPEVDEQGLYITKEGDDSHIHFEPVVALPEKIEVKTGEEDEDILFESRGKMYRFVSGEWKEKGLGQVKILQHKETKKTRVLMRREQILKICCNHMIESSLSLQPMARTDGKAWVWYALDFSEDENGKMEQLALRFKTAEIANEFKTVFDKCCEASTPSPSKGGSQDKGNVAAVKKELFKSDNQEDDDDVIFVKEEKPTEEQIKAARKYQLPDSFYLYELKPPCPGCLGCTDGEYIPSKMSVSPRPKKETSKPVQSPVVSSGTPKLPVVPSFGGGGLSAASASAKPVFGAVASSNLPDFSQLAPDTKTDSNEASSTNSGFVFGSNASVDFSSLAASGSSGDYAWKKAETGPFSFAGAGQKLFGGATSPGSNDAGGDDSQVEQSEDVHFDPVIPLPELVKVQTGEEDWNPLFTHRSKLYKFDKNLSQWKERGIGDIKIMKHKTQVLFRVLQRREQVLKVSCNHLISVDMEIKAMTTSETAWCWTAQDFTESEPSFEQFAVKFKTKEIAHDFKTCFEKCQEELKLHGEKKSGRDEIQDLSSPVEPHGIADFIPSAIAAAHVSQTHSLTHSALSTRGYNSTAIASLSGMASQATKLEGKLSPQTQAQPAPVKGAPRGKPSGKKGKKVPVSEAMSPTRQSKTGNKGNPSVTKALDVAGSDVITPVNQPKTGHKASAVSEPMSSSSQPKTGHKVSPLSEPVSSSSQPVTGDKGNPYMTKALDVAGSDIITPVIQPKTGHKASAVSEPMSSSCQPKTCHKPSPVSEPMSSSSQPVTGDKGNPYMTKALDVAGSDVITPINQPKTGHKASPVSEPMSSSSQPKTGDKGNPYMTKALDVAGSDVITPVNQPKTGHKASPVSEPMSSSSQPKTGDRGNPYMTKALDVAGSDAITPVNQPKTGHKASPISEPMSSSSQPVTGEKGNPYMTKALDVAGSDVITPVNQPKTGHKASPLSEPMSSSSQPVTGDKGNPYMTKALDVAGSDVITPVNQPKTGHKASPLSEPMSSSSQPVTGDKGNPYMTKALDVAGSDVITPVNQPKTGHKASLVGEPMSSSSQPKTGDKGNPYMTKALDVAGSDVITPVNQPKTGHKASPVGEPMSSSSQPKTGDKGNPYMTKALDVAGSDVITPVNQPKTGHKASPVGEPMSSSSQPKTGDKGKPYMTKALDVAGSDVITPVNQPKTGRKASPVGEPMSSSSQPKTGDKGNPYMTKALDVAGSDVITPVNQPKTGHKPSPVGEPMSSSSQPVTGDKGNPYMTKALDVAGSDVITPVNQPRTGHKASPVSEPMSSSSQPVTGDKGNPYMTKALDVAGSDVITPVNQPKTGHKPSPVGEPMSSSSQPVTGDKGNPYMTKALDVAGSDVITPVNQPKTGHKASPLSEPMSASSQPKTGHKSQPVSEPILSSSQPVTGDKGNPYMTKALDVAGSDVITPVNQPKTGHKASPVSEPMSSSSQPKTGDKGNPYMTKALDVAGSDVITPVNQPKTGHKPSPVGEPMSSSSQPVTGDKGNPYMTKALDVAGSDVITPVNQPKTGHKASPVSEPMSSSSQPVTGDKGNPYMTKALDVAGSDVITPVNQPKTGHKPSPVGEPMSSSSQPVTGDKGNPYMTKALDVAGSEVITPVNQPKTGHKPSPVGEPMSSSSQPVTGDKGNPYMTKALDVAGSDVITPVNQPKTGHKASPLSEPMSASSQPKTGHKSQPVSEPILSSSQPVTGDKGNPYMTKALDVAGSDVITPVNQPKTGHKASPVSEPMSSSSQPKTGDKGNPDMTKALDVAGGDVITPVNQPKTGHKPSPVGEPMSSSSQPVTGDKGNPYMTKALDVAGSDVITPVNQPKTGHKASPVSEPMSSPSQPVTGDKGNPYMTKALDVAGSDVITPVNQPKTGHKPSPVGEPMSSSSQPVTGEKGNPYMTKALDVAGSDVITPVNQPKTGHKASPLSEPMSASSQPKTGDKGNPYMTKALDVAGSDVITPVNQPKTGHKPSPVGEPMSSSSQPVTGDKGNPYMTKALDVAGSDVITPVNQPKTGHKASPVSEPMSSFSQPKTGDKGNPYMTKALDVAGSDVITPVNQPKTGHKPMSSSSQPVTGDKGNPYMTKALDVAGSDVITPVNQPKTGHKPSPVGEPISSSSQPVTGDKGNPDMTKALDVAGSDVITPVNQPKTGHKPSSVSEPMSSSSQPKTGDKGNPYMTKALDVAGSDIITPVNQPKQGTKSSPAREPNSSAKLTAVKGIASSVSSHPDSVNLVTNSSDMTKTVEQQPGQASHIDQEGAPNAQAQASASYREEEEDYDDEDDEYEDDDDDEDEDEEDIVYEKRATLSAFENNTWKNLGTGLLVVIYNDDISGNCIRFTSDAGLKLCSHVIARELNIACNPKNKSCEWRPLDYSTDEPVRRHFAASFSSGPAADEFRDIFERGRQLAIEAEISEKLPSEIDIPEVFSTGEPGHK